MVKKISSIPELQAVLAEAYTAKKTVLVDFFAEWCGPCKKIAPILEAKSVEHQNDVIVIKVDVDEATELSGAFQISCMPTFMGLIQKNDEVMVIYKLEGADVKSLENFFVQSAEPKVKAFFE